VVARPGRCHHAAARLPGRPLDRNEADDHDALHHQWRDPGERLQDRVEQVIQRFETMRDRADQLIRAAERVFQPGRAETTRKESAPAAPADPD
jgi:hypothetical protein